MKKILVPTDFSRPAENALQTALAVAKAFGASIELLHVLEISSSSNIDVTGGPSNVESLTDFVEVHEGIKLAKKHLDSSFKLHDVASSGVQVEQNIRLGSVLRQIIEFVETNGVDMVIMGTNGASGLDEYLLGTNTDKLIRRINVPVLAVHDPVPDQQFKKIVLPTTTYDKEDNLLRVVKAFQEKFNSTLYLLRVNTPLHFLPDKRSLEMLREYAVHHKLTNYEVHVYSHTEEEDGIQDFADMIEADMIAMSTSATKGLRKIIGGSVTKEIVNRSRRPVLTMRMDDQ
ncbi:MAG TPA: universal stress protein [Flammeovirgaceae bacterium]|nr:universal stress protein [Flammeovirgaceae bacterium]